MKKARKSGLFSTCYLFYQVRLVPVVGSRLPARLLCASGAYPATTEAGTENGAERRPPGTSTSNRGSRPATNIKIKRQAIRACLLILSLPYKKDIKEIFEGQKRSIYAGLRLLWFSIFRSVQKRWQFSSSRCAHHSTEIFARIGH